MLFCRLLFAVAGITAVPENPSGVRAVSSAVERLVYTERAGGSNPSPPIRPKSTPGKISGDDCLTGARGQPKRCALLPLRE